MTTTKTPSIRDLFSEDRPIDRPIEKVIDYYATDELRLQAEIDEYEVTDNVEQNLRRFLDIFDHGLSTGQVTDTGIWVSGFYGSGKSSFTKYLGIALSSDRTVGGHPFVELLGDRISSLEVRQHLKTVATRHPVAVIMLDLGNEQLASSASESVTTVLYWKVLEWAGYSKIEKIAALELRLEREGRLDEFREAYTQEFGGSWSEVHNDPLTADPRADQLVPRFFPQDFPEPGAFRILRYSLVQTVLDRAAEMIEIARRKSGCENVLFLIDEAGQYVAPRGELILNLDGLARSFKELGQGKVWIVATGQQTLSEISERAAYNSAELNKLRDRFPNSIELDARDIREITWRRLLTKSAEGESLLTDLYRRHGQSLAANTRLTNTALFKGDPDEQSFLRLYPFLPQHFDLLLELTRRLARSRGGIGLRSAIRVIQDVLVDATHLLPPGSLLLANGAVGRLATADLFFNTLRADIAKEHAHAVTGVERTERAMPDDELAIRVAKAIAALQPIETFPRTAENIAALLYANVGDPPHLDAVRSTLLRLLEEKELGLIDDPQAGGYTFLSEAVKPIRQQRDAYIPTAGEIMRLRQEVLADLFEQPPSVVLHQAKTVRAGLRYESTVITGGNEEIQFRLEKTDGGNWDQRRSSLLTETIGDSQWRNSIAWLFRTEDALEDNLVEAARSRNILGHVVEAEADQAVAQFIRAERLALERFKGYARSSYEETLKEGVLIFRGNPTAAAVAGPDLQSAAKKALEDAATEIYNKLHMASIRPDTNLAEKFLNVERLDRIQSDMDPLGFVSRQAGRPRIDLVHPTLAEALQELQTMLDDAGTSRLQGIRVQDHFAAPPYGWTKDATRYIFAGLLAAGEIVLHPAGDEVRTLGPAAAAAMKNTQAFNKAGVALRESRPTIEELDRAANRLESLFGQSVLPLEDQIANAVRERLPVRLEQVASLPTHLRLLGLAGAERAQGVADNGQALLQQEGAGAIGVLGPVDCAFPDDLRWAENVTEALANGADEDVKSAQSIIHGATELAKLFPSLRRLAGEADQDVLDAVISSEDFVGRLPNLRSATRQVLDGAKEAYQQELETYSQELEAAQARLESRPEWLMVSEEDRAELATRLVLDLTHAPPSDQIFEHLRTLLVRGAQVKGLEDQLSQDLDRRVPEPQDGDLPERVVNLADLLPSLPLTSPEELEAWLERIRAEILTALDEKKLVRLVMKSAAVESAYALRP